MRVGPYLCDREGCKLQFSTKMPIDKLQFSSNVVLYAYVKTNYRKRYIYISQE